MQERALSLTDTITLIEHGLRLNNPTVEAAIGTLLVAIRLADPEGSSTALESAHNARQSWAKISYAVGHHAVHVAMNRGPGTPPYAALENLIDVASTDSLSRIYV